MEIQPRRDACFMPAILTLLILFSVVAGWLIPYFYDWTDSDQSRPSPLLWQVPLGIFLVSVVVCCGLPWLPIREKGSEEDSIRMRFGLRTMLILTALIALVIGLGMKFPGFVSSMLLGLALFGLVVLAIKRPSQRLAAITLLACMFLPFSWLLGYEDFDRMLTALPTFLPSMPTLLPAGLLANVFRQPLQDSFWIAHLLTAIELLVGIWIMASGPKRAIAYLLLVMNVSLFGSLIFLQLVLA